MSPLDREILSYFREHPEASDTIEGIACWWLKERLRNRPVNEVKVALDHLVSLGVLTERIDISGRAHYRLRRKLNGLRV